MSQANNQHELAGEVTADPSQSSFVKAIELAEGKVVSILDSAGVTYTRIWCCFEIFKSLLDVGDGAAHKTYDIYTACDLYKMDNRRKEGAVGIVEGMSAGDKDAAAKQDRESHFPLERVQLDLKLQTAQASVESDQRSILNAICGQEADAEPLAEHTQYDVMNAMLAGRFAAGMLSVVVARGKPR